VPLLQKFPLPLLTFASNYELKVSNDKLRPLSRLGRSTSVLCADDIDLECLKILEAAQWTGYFPRQSVSSGKNRPTRNDQ
jgi:hypothetical protein